MFNYSSVFFHQKEFSANHMAKPGGSVTQIIQVLNLCRTKKNFHMTSFLFCFILSTKCEPYSVTFTFCQTNCPHIQYDCRVVCTCQIQYILISKWIPHSIPSSATYIFIASSDFALSRFQHLAHQAFETIVIITSCQQNTTVNGK